MVGCYLSWHGVSFNGENRQNNPRDRKIQNVSKFTKFELKLFITNHIAIKLSAQVS